HELIKRLVLNGHRVVHVSPRASGLERKEILDGVLYLRCGNVISVILHAAIFYLSHRRRFSYVVDQCNTHQFFTPFYVEAAKRIFLIHQLTREIWKVQAPWPLKYIGAACESSWLRLHRKDMTITVSQSTRDDLLSLGFGEGRVFIVPNGIARRAAPFESLLPKNEPPYFVYMGRYSRYKGIDDSIRALALLKKSVPQARLVLLGKPDGKYIERSLRPLCSSLSLTIGTEDGCDVFVKGFVDEDTKFDIIGRAMALLFPSMREGWGIIVTEASVSGTPAIVYDSPGCRDAVDMGKAGYLCRSNSPESLAAFMQETLSGGASYQEMRYKAWDFSRQFTYEKTLGEFEAAFGRVYGAV
ncbi:MAG: glycosyltransferase family 4 protein, partial [Treponema sp.]|nr:glycosyltransferase family 4 protein [Treponema sp.]